MLPFSSNVILRYFFVLHFVQVNLPVRSHLMLAQVFQRSKLMCAAGERRRDCAIKGA